MKPKLEGNYNSRGDNKTSNILEKTDKASVGDNQKCTYKKWSKLSICVIVLTLISVGCYFALANDSLYKFYVGNVGNKIYTLVSRYKYIYTLMKSESLNLINKIRNLVCEHLNELLPSLRLFLINLEYKLSVVILDTKYYYKTITRKYKVVQILQAVSYRIFRLTMELLLILKNKGFELIVESSNNSFYFYLFVLLLVIVLFWDKVVMKEYCKNSKVKSFKIMASTISTLITVFYLPLIEKLLFRLIEIGSNNFYSFCSNVYLNTSEKVLDNGYYSYNYDDIIEFSVISKDWWRSKKLDSIFRGVELINEVKRRYNRNNHTVKEVAISDYVSSGYISKEFCNSVLNGNIRLRIGFRIATIFIGTLSTLSILYNERGKFNMNEEKRIYSKIYLVLTVVSGIFIPILLNNIQRTSAYSGRREMISILVFLIFKIVTNYNHFVSLTTIIVDNISSKFKSKNNIEKMLIPNNKDMNENGLEGYLNVVDKNNTIRTNENSQTKYSEAVDKNRKTGLLFKSNINNRSNKTSPRSITNSRANRNKEPLDNTIRIGQINELLRKNVTKARIDEKLSSECILSGTERSRSRILSIISTIINSFKTILIDKLVNLCFYIINKNYRGKVLTATDHYKLRKYIDKSSISMNTMEELLKSMTLCYTNIGNIAIIRSITIGKMDLVKELNNFKHALPDKEVLSKLGLYCNNSVVSAANNKYDLSEIEKNIYPFSLILALENKINVQIQYYMVLNSISILTYNCEAIKMSCRKIINSESLVQLINNISNNDVNKITKLLNSKMDYKTISDILISSMFVSNNKSDILNKFSTVNNSYNKVNEELVEDLDKLNNLETREIFSQWNILRCGLRLILSEIKENRRSYEEIYMGGLPLHTLQMALHHLNALARKTSDLVQESIIACGEFCLYFNLKSLDELNELNNTSSGQLKLFDLCIKDCKDILNLVKTIKDVMMDICDKKLRIEGREIDISYLSSLLPPMISNADHRCCRIENDNSCKLHGKGLQETYKLYSEGNCPAVNVVGDQIKVNKRFIPERPKSSIPREPSNTRNVNEKDSLDDNCISSLQTSLRRPVSVNRINQDSGVDCNNSNMEKLPFLMETPGEKTGHIII